MNEVWLRANARPWIAIFVGYALVLFGASSLWVRAGGDPNISGILMMTISMILVPWFARKRAILRYKDGHLLVNRFRDGGSRVPIDLVEGFLLGQGPSYLPGKKASRLETSTLVIRLAERASEWERQPMPSRLGSWCGHYVTLRGTWCEPLTLELVNRLNTRLYEVKQSRAAEQVSA